MTVSNTITHSTSQQVQLCYVKMVITMTTLNHLFVAADYYEAAVEEKMLLYTVKSQSLGLHHQHLYVPLHYWTLYRAAL